MKPQQSSNFVTMSASFRETHLNRHYSNIVSVVPMKMSEKIELARMTAEAAVLSLWGSTCAVLSSDKGAAGMPPGIVDNITEFAVRTMGKGEMLGKVPESLAGCLCVLAKDPIIGGAVGGASCRITRVDPWLLERPEP